LNPNGAEATVLLEGRQFLWIFRLLFVGTGQPQIRKEIPMTSTNPKDKGKAPAQPARPQHPSELEARDLDKVTGGLKRAKTEDPCGGGE
jgi:hypothetical protein